jgi:hypothetical protein
MNENDIKYRQEKDTLIKEYNDKISDERMMNDSHLFELKSTQSDELKKMKLEYNDTIQEYQRIIDNHSTILQQMQSKWDNRESRSEDIEMIRKLHTDVTERNRLIERITEELNVVRRELLNREEVYNQKFNRSPNVGVMQVLKPKDPVTSSTHKRPQLQPIAKLNKLQTHLQSISHMAPSASLSARPDNTLYPQNVNTLTQNIPNAQITQHTQNSNTSNGLRSDIIGDITKAHSDSSFPTHKSR